MRVGIVGLGLIGGSIGLALREPANEILGSDVSERSCATAVARGCVDRIVELAELYESEIIFVAVPPAVAVSTVTTVLEGTEAVVTDCTSVKGPVVELALAKRSGNFVPGHPMAGHEKGGAEFASAWMYRGAKWLLTPTPYTKKPALKLVETVIKQLGATPITVSAEEHDRQVALQSHLPHVLAATLLRMAASANRADIGAGSWRDLTRVGGADPQLWTQILLENRSSMLQILTEFEDDLRQVREALESDNPEAVQRYFESARQAKGSL